MFNAQCVSLGSSTEAQTKDQEKPPDHIKNQDDSLDIENYKDN